MSDETLRQREKAARKEYPQTQAAFDRVRSAATARIFATRPGEAEKREEIYRLVHILDEVERELLGAMGQGSEEIDLYVEGLANA